MRQLTVGNQVRAQRNDKGDAVFCHGVQFSVIRPNHWQSPNLRYCQYRVVSVVFTPGDGRKSVQRATTKKGDAVFCHGVKVFVKRAYPPICATFKIATKRYIGGVYATS